MRKIIKIYNKVIQNKNKCLTCKTEICYLIPAFKKYTGVNIDSFRDRISNLSLSNPKISLSQWPDLNPRYFTRNSTSFEETLKFRVPHYHTTNTMEWPQSQIISCLCGRTCKSYVKNAREYRKDLDGRKIPKKLER